MMGTIQCEDGLKMIIVIGDTEVPTSVSPTQTEVPTTGGGSSYYEPQSPSPTQLTSIITSMSFIHILGCMYV